MNSASSSRSLPGFASQLDPDAAPTMTTPGRVGLWRGAGRSGESGLVALDGLVALSFIELAGIPAEWRPGDAAAAGRREQLQGALRSAAHAVAPLGAEHALALRIVHDPARPRPFRVLLVARSAAAGADELRRSHVGLRRALFAALPDAVRWVDHDPSAADPAMTLDFVRSAVELGKAEAWAASGFAPPHAPVSHYYAPAPWRDGGDVASTDGVWPLLLRAIGHFPQRRTAVEVTLVGGGAPTRTEVEAIDGWIAGCEAWSRPQQRSVPYGSMGKMSTVEFDADPPAAACAAWWRGCRAQYAGAAPVLLAAVRVLWDDPRPPVELAHTIVERALAPRSRPQLHAWAEGQATFDRALQAARLGAISPAVCGPVWLEPDAPETLRRVQRMVTVGELGALWSLPSEPEAQLPGMPVDRPSWTAPGGLRDLLPAHWWGDSSAASLRVPFGWARPAAPHRPPAEHALVLGDEAPHALVAGLLPSAYVEVSQPAFAPTR